MLFKSVRLTCHTPVLLEHVPCKVLRCQQRACRYEGRLHGERHLAHPGVDGEQLLGESGRGRGCGRVTTITGACACPFGNAPIWERRGPANIKPMKQL